MINLVLDDPGVAIFGIEFQRLTLHILGRDMDFAEPYA